MTIAQLFATSITQLKAAGITSSRLDAQLLLCDELGQDKSWLLAHPDIALTDVQVTNIRAKLIRRVAHEPMAYIRGKQEFYGREFAVNPHVLIPRPESEALIELLAGLSPAGTLVDVGTGSGCLAITAALEWPALTVYGTDVDAEALQASRHNAEQLRANVNFERHNLLEDFTVPANVITANLPYVDRSWERSKETDFEPSVALFAEDHGLALIKTLIPQAAQLLTSNGYLLLEADPRQHQAINQFASKHGFSSMQTRDFALALQKQ